MIEKFNVIGNFNEDGSIDFNEEIISKMFSETPFDNEKCLKCNKLPLCYGPCIQNYYDTKRGKTSFNCIYNYTELSFEEYVRSKATQQVNILKKKNDYA